VKKLHKILVVDDDDLVLSSLKSELGEKYDVITVTRATEALSVISQQKIDCIVSDVRMPGMGGVALLKEIGNRDPFIGRILLTAYSDAEATDTAIEEESVFKVSKPWHDQLEIAIQRAMELRGIKVQLEYSMQRFDRGLEIERLFRRYKDPLKVIEESLRFAASLGKAKAAEVVAIQGDNIKRLAIASDDKVMFENSVAIPNRIEVERLEPKIERLGKEWLYMLPLWTANNDSWQFKCYLSKLHQEELSWIDFIVEQLVGAMEKLVLVFEVSRRRREVESSKGQLITMQKMASLGLLAAGVAHEINNAAGYIRASFPASRDYLDEIKKTVSRLEELVRESGSLELDEKWNQLKQKVQFDNCVQELGDILEETHEGIERIIGISMNLRSFSHKGKAERERVKIKHCLDTSLAMVMYKYKSEMQVLQDYNNIPDVLGNSAELGQVFLNIFLNAAQAMEGHGQLKVATYYDDGWVVVDIKDDGPGIDDKTLGSIFEPLFTTKEVGVGTGLGLSISKDIVDKHGGQIEVSSKLGQGAVFNIRLPALEELSR
jgi:signal transduction histidine kinase/CheY-like chemotaxis protein